MRERIVDCTYAPGTILGEDALTDQLKVSRTPIRDAISRLEQEGLVTILPKKGVMVSNLSIAELHSIFEMRMIFEPYVLEHYGSTLDDGALFSFYERFHHDTSLSSEERYALDDEFHEFIMAAATNSYMQQSYRLIRAQSARFRILTGNLLANRYEAGRLEHIEILSHCLKKNWAEASRGMMVHLSQSKNACFDSILKEGSLNLSTLGEGKPLEGSR